MFEEPGAGYGSLNTFNSAALRAIAGIGSTNLNTREQNVGAALDAFGNGALMSLAGPGQPASSGAWTRYRTQSYPRHWVTPVAIADDGGDSVPRLNWEQEMGNPRTWPTIYQVPARGLAPQTSLIRGPAPYVFNDRLSGGSFAYRTTLPGMAKTPFGG